MKTFKTQTEAIDFLVEQGKPIAHARVAILEAFDHEYGKVKTDWLRGDDEWSGYEINEDVPFDDTEDADFPAIIATEEDIISIFEQFCGPEGDFKLTEKGWEFQGSLEDKYNVDGTHNKL